MSTGEVALARPRLAPRRRRLGVPAPRRHRAPDAARPDPDRSPPTERAAPCSTPWVAAAPTSSAPSPTRVGRTDDTGARRRAVGAGLVRAGHRRHHRPAARAARPAGAPPTSRTPSGPRRTRYAGRRGPLGGPRRPARPSRPTLPARTGPPHGRPGRWSLLPPVEPDPTVRAYATAELLLDRYGVLTRGSVVAEDVPGGFAAVYRVLAAAEEAGRVRRGYFVEGLAPRSSARPARSTGCAAARASVRLRAATGRAQRGAGRLVLAASDPANPYGAALPWPDARSTRQPTATADDAPDGQPAASGGGTSPAARRAPSSCSSTASSCSTSSGAARRCCPGPDDPSCSERRPTPSPCAVREGSPRPAHRREGRRRSVLGSGHPLVAALAKAGFHAHPARAAAAAGDRSCPRVTRSRAPPTGSTPHCATRWSSGPSCAGPRSRRRPQRVAHPRGREPRQAPAAPVRHRVARCTRTCGWRAVAGRAPGRAHRAGAAPPRPAGRRAHRPVVGVRPAARHARPRAHRPRVRPRRPPRPRRARPRLGCRGGGGAGHGVHGLRRRRAARPAEAGRGGHLLGQRDPVHRAGAALDPGGRPRPRAGPRPPRAAAPPDGHRPPHRLAGQHRHPADG